ncbi:MAG TPA: hypothetical protein VF219_10615 [Vicinamibacterales bacterium]
MPDAAWDLGRVLPVEAQTSAPRHSAIVRATHWATTLCFVALLVGGVTATDSLKPFGKGLGSASPEGGYAWYAGI